MKTKASFEKQVNKYFPITGIEGYAVNALGSVLNVQNDTVLKELWQPTVLGSRTLVSINGTDYCPEDLMALAFWRNVYTGYKVSKVSKGGGGVLLCKLRVANPIGCLPPVILPEAEELIHGIKEYTASLQAKRKTVEVWCSSDASELRKQEIQRIAEQCLSEVAAIMYRYDPETKPAQVYNIANYVAKMRMEPMYEKYELNLGLKEVIVQLIKSNFDLKIVVINLESKLRLRREVMAEVSNFGRFSFRHIGQSYSGPTNQADLQLYHLIELEDLRAHL